MIIHNNQQNCPTVRQRGCEIEGTLFCARNDELSFSKWFLKFRDRNPSLVTQIYGQLLRGNYQLVTDKCKVLISCDNQDKLLVTKHLSWEF